MIVSNTQYIIVNYIFKAKKYVIRPVNVYWSYKAYRVINLPSRHIQKINYLKNTAETTGLPEIEKGRTSSQTGSRALSFCMLGSMAEVDMMEGDGWLNISLSGGNSVELIKSQALSLKDVLILASRWCLRTTASLWPNLFDWHITLQPKTNRNCKCK